MSQIVNMVHKKKYMDYKEILIPPGRRCFNVVCPLIIYIYIKKKKKKTHAAFINNVSVVWGLGELVD